jgi:hypothetical protein
MPMQKEFAKQKMLCFFIVNGPMACFTLATIGALHAEKCYKDYPGKTKCL